MAGKTDPAPAKRRDPIVSAIALQTAAIDVVASRLSQVEGSVSGLSKGFAEADRENIAAIRAVQQGFGELSRQVSELTELIRNSLETQKTSSRETGRKLAAVVQRVEALEARPHGPAE